MLNPSYRGTALHYCVDDLAGANIPGTRLQNILDCLRLGRPLTRLSLGFLRQHGLEALYGLASGMLSYGNFRELAITEQAIRTEAATAREAEKRTRDAAMQAKMRLACELAEVTRLARESDPKYIAKIKNQQLRARYGVDTFVEQLCFGWLMNILKSIDAGQRLSPDDFVWLSSRGKDYFSDQLRTAYHRLEADFFASEFKKTRDPWMAVNASSHYRKCGNASDAASLLGTINVDLQKSPKLKAALCTTLGGGLRDLKRWDEALRLGEKAHAFQADNYRPCTLLGAIYMETGDYSLGQEWYAKAVERGATLDSVDQDLRNIFYRADQAKQVEMKKFLLSTDPDRYAWVRTPRS